MSRCAADSVSKADRFFPVKAALPEFPCFLCQRDYPGVLAEAPSDSGRLVAVSRHAEHRAALAMRRAGWRPFPDRCENREVVRYTALKRGTLDRIATDLIPLWRVQMAIGIGRRKFIATLDSATSLVWPLATRPQQAKAITCRLLALSAATLAATTMACSAGACSPEIERMQARLNARLEAAASAGLSAPQSSDALLHHQPTPGSIARAEIKLGELSPEKAKLIREALARAREADQTGDKAACAQALAEVQRIIGP